MSQETTKAKINYKTLFPILLMFFTIGQMTSDMYVPSMPAITSMLHTTTSMIQWSMSAYMLSFSLSQLVYGPLADHYGRKMAILIGVGIGVGGSFICYGAISPGMLIVGRLIQGIGMGAGITLGSTISRDLFSGSKLAKVGSLMGIGTTIVIGSSPILGGYFQHYLGWRSVFGFLSIYTVILWFLVCFLLPETSPDNKPKKLRFKKVFSHYWTLLTSKTFLGYTLCTTFAYAGCLAFYTMSTFLLQEKVGLSPIAYGWSCIVITLAFLIGSIVNVHFVTKVGINFMMFVGTVFMVIAGSSMLIAALLGYMNLFVIVIPAMIYGFGAIFLICNAFAGAVTPFPYIAGAASALFGAMQIGGGFVSTSLIASLKFSTQEPLAIIYLTIGILAFVALKYAISDKKSKARK